MTEEHISNPEKGLPLGSKAPMIEKNDVFENPVNFLNLIQNSRGVLLDFSRGAWWIYWKKQLSKLNQSIAEFEKKSIKLIAISTDRAKALKKLAEKEEYKFIVVSDDDAKISMEYDVYGKPIDYDMIKIELAIPTTYLIDSDGIIVWRYVGTKTDRPSIEEILEAIDNKL